MALFDANIWLDTNFSEVKWFGKPAVEVGINTLRGDNMATI